MINRRLQTEYYHFVQLGEDARRLLISFSFYSLVQPLIFGFINAFLFRQNQSFIAVVQYNLGLFISIPLFFYLNGWLLSQFRLKRLYQFGLLGQALALNLLFFIPTSNWLGLVSFGFLQGIFVGLYWANRNFMSLEITNDTNRQYFIGLEQILAIGSELVAPLIIGAVIALSTITNLLSIQSAYKVLGVITFILLVIAAKVLGEIRVPTPKITKLFVINTSLQWWYARLAEAIYGSFHGILMFLPALLVFQLIGREGALGLVQSVAALVTAVVIYYLSRKLKPTQRIIITGVAVAVVIITTLFLSVSFTSLAALILLTVVPATNRVRWLTWNPTVMSAIDAQDKGQRNTNYAYIADRELFLNIGRIASVAIFVLSLHFFSESGAVRYSPVAIGLAQLLFIVAMHKVIDLHPQNKKMDKYRTVVETTAETV